MNSLADRQFDAIAGKLDPEPTPAEALFLAGFFLGAAMWLAWARYWRLV